MRSDRKQVKIHQQQDDLPASCRSLIVDPKMKGAGAKLRSYEWSKNAETKRKAVRESERACLKINYVHDEPFASKRVRLILRGYEKVSATVFAPL